MTTTTSEAHWGRFFYYTDMRIMLWCHCQAAPPPKHQQVSLLQLRVYWQKTLREKEVAIFFDSLTDETGAVTEASFTSGGILPQRHIKKKKTDVTHWHTFSNLSVMVFSLCLVTVVIKNILMWFPVGFQGGSVICFLVLYFSPCTENLVFYLLTCCLNCPVLCFQPLPLPHCDYFVFIYC